MPELPTELWTSIFQYIDPKHYLVLKRVDRIFYIAVALTFDSILRGGGLTKMPTLNIFLKQECSKTDIKFTLVLFS
jgi:hypothetical protein